MSPLHVLRVLPLLCACASGCYLSYGLDADTRSTTDAASSTDADAGAARDALTAPLDASAPLDGAVTTGMATVDESATCANGPARWAAICPDATIVYVSPDGRDGAVGSAADPFASPSGAMEHCARACHLRLVAGIYAMRGNGLGGDCLYVEGGGALDAVGAWTPSTGAASTLVGSGRSDTMISSGSALVVTGVSIRDVHSGIAVSGASLLVVDHVSIDASYSGLNIAWSSSGARVCNSTFVGGYVGVDIAWGSSDVVLDRVDVTGGYQGIDVNWSSHDVSVRNSTVRGGHEGVGVGTDAYDVQLKNTVVITTGG